MPNYIQLDRNRINPAHTQLLNQQRETRRQNLGALVAEYGGVESAMLANPDLAANYLANSGLSGGMIDQMFKNVQSGQIAASQNLKGNQQLATQRGHLPGQVQQPQEAQPQGQQQQQQPQSQPPQVDAPQLDLQQASQGGEGGGYYAYEDIYEANEALGNLEDSRPTWADIKNDFTRWLGLDNNEPGATRGSRRSNAPPPSWNDDNIVQALSELNTEGRALIQNGYPDAESFGKSLERFRSKNPDWSDKQILLEMANWQRQLGTSPSTQARTVDGQQIPVTGISSPVNPDRVEQGSTRNVNNYIRTINEELLQLNTMTEKEYLKSKGRSVDTSDTDYYATYGDDIAADIVWEALSDEEKKKFGASDDERWDNTVGQFRKNLANGVVDDPMIQEMFQSTKSTIEQYQQEKQVNNETWKKSLDIPKASTEAGGKFAAKSATNQALRQARTADLGTYTWNALGDDVDKVVQTLQYFESLEQRDPKMFYALMPERLASDMQLVQMKGEEAKTEVLQFEAEKVRKLLGHPTYLDDITDYEVMRAKTGTDMLLLDSALKQAQLMGLGETSPNLVGMLESLVKVGNMQSLQDDKELTKIINASVADLLQILNEGQENSNINIDLMFSRIFGKLKTNVSARGRELEEMGDTSAAYNTLAKDFGLE